MRNIIKNKLNLISIISIILMLFCTTIIVLGFYTIYKNHFTPLYQIKNKITKSNSIDRFNQLSKSNLNNIEKLKEFQVDTNAYFKFVNNVLFIKNINKYL
jgi:hypothetical protein